MLLSLPIPSVASSCLWDFFSEGGTCLIFHTVARRVFCALSIEWNFFLGGSDLSFQILLGKKNQNWSTGRKLCVDRRQWETMAGQGQEQMCDREEVTRVEDISLGFTSCPLPSTFIWLEALYCCLSDHELINMKVSLWAVTASELALNNWPLFFAFILFYSFCFLPLMFFYL
jgi:hypothetical protein